MNWGFAPFNNGLSSPVVQFYNRAPCLPEPPDREQDGGMPGRLGNTVCVISAANTCGGWQRPTAMNRRKQLWQGWTRARGLEQNCPTSVLLQWSERRSDAVRWAGVSEMEREIKRWQEGDKGAVKSVQGEENTRTAGVGKKYRPVIKERRFIRNGQSDGDLQAMSEAGKEPELTV